MDTQENGNSVSLIPARYAKAITSLVGLLITYLQMYGATWHLVPAVTAVAAALAVLGVPNSPFITPYTKIMPPPVTGGLPPRT